MRYVVRNDRLMTRAEANVYDEYKAWVKHEERVSRYAGLLFAGILFAAVSAAAYFGLK